MALFFSIRRFAKRCLAQGLEGLFQSGKRNDSVQKLSPSLPPGSGRLSEGQSADNLANGLASASEAITRPSASLHRLGEYTLFLNR